MPRSTGRSLAQAGHDVVHIAATDPAADDRSVLGRARDDGRMLVTFDADFGDLVYQRGELPPPAILYLRMHPIDGATAASMVLQALAGPVDGQFVVCTRDGLRRRPLPAASVLMPANLSPLLRRIYLARVGLELPPIDATRRLTGEASGVRSRVDPLAPATPADALAAALWPRLGESAPTGDDAAAEALRSDLRAPAR